MKRFFALGLVAALVLADQLIKRWGLETLAKIGQIEVIPGLFNLTYVENRGAAFGILQGKTMILSVVSGALLLVIAALLIMDRIKPDFFLWTISIGLAGGIGNLCDRVTRGFVVDYLDFSALFGFPVFNFADCCVVCATVLILIYLIVTDSKRAAKTSGEEA